MFYNEKSNARWVHVFKKDPKSQSQEIRLAVARADECWNAI